MEDKPIQVSDTAFVTCGFRRLNENLSLDPYAKLWFNDKAELILQDYVKRVSTEEIDTHCIRNRFFLNTLQSFVDAHKIEILINFGAGFSMYPFLLDEHISHIEIDKPDLVHFKSEKTQQWISEGKLPDRHIDFIGVDFSTDYETDLINTILRIKSDKSCFILIEGVLFFLNKSETKKIFTLFDTLQHKGDYIGSVSYTDEVLKTDAFHRLIAYANQGVNDASDEGFQYIEDRFYENLEHYKITDHKDYFSSSRMFKHTPKCDYKDILNEHFYILQKQ